MTKKLTQKQLDHFKNLFLKQKEQITIFCNKNQESAEIDLEGDDVDQIQANILNNIDSRILEREAQKLIKIDCALAKINDGTFGHCEECDELIAVKRLEARPEAEFCILCAERIEFEAKTFSTKNS